MFTLCIELLDFYVHETASQIVAKTSFLNQQNFIGQTKYFFLLFSPIGWYFKIFFDKEDCNVLEHL